jgi:hypothetical protein
MKPAAKVALVLGGYVLAVVAGVVASYLYNARVSALPYDTSGGMYAGGELLFSTAVFLAVALVPTLLALWFLRGQRRLWWAISLGSLGFAVAGLIAVLAPLLERGAPSSPAMVLVGLLGLAQLLGMPLWTAAFVLFAVIAPPGPARRLLLVAVGVELVIGVCALIHWFVPRPPL